MNRNAYETIIENLKRQGHLSNIGIEKIILKLILKTWYGLDSTGSG
jgi:hypothetical protein